MSYSVGDSLTSRPARVTRRFRSAACQHGPNLGQWQWMPLGRLPGRGGFRRGRGKRSAAANGDRLQLLGAHHQVIELRAGLIGHRAARDGAHLRHHLRCRVGI